jgi:hemoglobin-like flavoprotein
LAGARQEITSILQGTIDQNSALAKSLAITNTQIQQEKAKGTLVEFLLKKTEALTSAQSLMAKTFGGVTSNIVELFQRLQESFGKVVLPPVVEQLTKVYDSLTAAQPQIEAFVSNLSSGLVAISTQVGTVLAQFIPRFKGYLLP